MQGLLYSQNLIYPDRFLFSLKQALFHKFCCDLIFEDIINLPVDQDRPGAELCLILQARGSVYGNPDDGVIQTLQ